MKTIELVFFDAGGGHRSAANALCEVSRREQRPWDMQMMNLQELLDDLDVFRKITGIRFQDIYNLMLRKGWTLGSKQMLAPMHAIIRMFHPQQVKGLERYWAQKKPDLVVSVVPNFNRALFEAKQKALPDVPFVTILTDMADYPPHFWLERQGPHYVICGTERAREQALELGHAPERVFLVSGMILNPRYYDVAPVDREAERVKLGLDPKLPTALMMFGGAGSSRMVEITQRLNDSGLEMQMIAICGKNDKLEMALRGLLVSPDFLFRIEHDPLAGTGAVHRVNDFELASRLSFFLWSSVPDDELLKLAEEGKLKDPKVLQQQTARMMDDPKSKAFVNNFAGQYLFVRNLETQKPDPDEFPEFDNGLRRSFEEETTLFFNAIVRENRPVTALLDAKFTFLNERLAEFYGVPGVHGPQFRRVEITDPNRGGILGQGSLLTVTSYPNRTSVVQRGKWVLENLLGTPPPPPPPNVPSLDPHGKDGKLSMRQAMEEHRANPVCASCHSRMDPIGFALENYDGVGAWRDKDKGSGTPIDASGKLPDGAEFNGPNGLKNLLLTEHRDDFISTFTQKLMTYALGRGVEASDLPAVRAIMRDAAKQNDTIPALIDAIVRSPQFQMRRNQPS